MKNKPDPAMVKITRSDFPDPPRNEPVTPVTHIALELELEQPRSKPQTADSQIDTARVIQVGWTVFRTEPDMEVLAVREYEINIGVPLSAYIRDLTGISDDDIAQGLSHDKVFTILMRDRELFETSRIVLSWGGNELEPLRRDSEFHEDPFGRNCRDVKQIYQTFAEARGLKRRLGLSKAVAQLGLAWQGRNKHRAAVDSLNTALVFSYLYHQFSKVE